MLPNGYVVCLRSKFSGKFGCNNSMHLSREKCNCCVSLCYLAMKYMDEFNTTSMYFMVQGIIKFYILLFLYYFGSFTDYFRQQYLRYLYAN
jgi:hypothetical protein